MEENTNGSTINKIELNRLRLSVNAVSLSNLDLVGTNTYRFYAHFLNSVGVPITDSRVPTTPYAINVVTTTPSFTVDIPIDDGTYNINDVTIKLYGNGDNNECCYAIAETDIHNCNVTIDTTFVQCNGIAGLVIDDADEPLSISVKISPDATELYLDRDGDNISFKAFIGAPRTYQVKVTDTNGCIGTKSFDLACYTPNFNIEGFNATCDGSTVVNGYIRLFNPVNATRYKLCYGIGPCFANCATSDGTINPTGDTIIPITNPTAGTTQNVTIRIYNGTGCLQYTDYPLSFYGISCGTTCPPDGTWTENAEGTWYKKLTAAPTSTPSGYTIVTKQSSFYAIDGTRLYNTALSSFTTLSSIPLWKANSGTNGPMNRCSIWTNKEDGDFPNNYLPLNSWIGFTHCLTGLTVGKTYYVGIEADNYFRLFVDSIKRFEVLTTDTHFRTWKIIPVVAKKSDMLISMEALNTDRVAGFGCEIYDNTSSQITAATNIGDLNIIFSSASKVGSVFSVGGLYGGIQYGYACPDGYKYSSCEGTCIEIIYCT